MTALRDELYMQMWSLHTKYDCACKVMMNHHDLQKLPERQAKGALQKIWSDWTFSNMKSSKEAHKAISRENARRMIDTTNMLMQDRREAYQSGRLLVYMEDVVRRLERLQRGESEEEEKSHWLAQRKQEIWNEQYLQHHGYLKNLKGHYEARFIINEILGPKPETPLLDNIATQEQFDKLEED